jgi:hypothetical protein
MFVFIFKIVLLEGDLVLSIFGIRAVKVLSTVSSHANGVTLDELGVELNTLYSDSMIFGSFKDYIRSLISSGRLSILGDKLFLTNNGERFLLRNTISN